MEIVLAIVWFLALLMPGNTYTEQDIYNIGVEHRTAVQTVYNHNLNDAMDFMAQNHYSNHNIDVMVGTWEDEPKDYTDTTLFDPWDHDILAPNPDPNK